MHPVVGANIETDVSLTVAQISIVSVLLTYEGFGIHKVQKVHQKTTSTPTFCFYCNYFIGTATAWIWKKQHFSNFMSVTSSSMYRVLIYSLQSLLE